MNAVRSRFGRKMDLVGNKRLSRKRDFKRSNRLTFAPACVCGDWEIWWPRFVPDGTACSLGSNWLERSRTPHSRPAQRFTLFLTSLLSPATDPKLRELQPSVFSQNTSKS